MHLGYNTVTLDNDIAVLKLESKITFVQDSVQPACLPDVSFAPDETGVTAFASGWGLTNACPPCLPQNDPTCAAHQSSADLRFQGKVIEYILDRF